MLPVNGADPGGPGDHVPATDDVHDGGEAWGHAHSHHQTQEVIVSPQHQVEDVSHKVQAPGDQIENWNIIWKAVNTNKFKAQLPIETIFFCLLFREFSVFDVIARYVYFLGGRFC